MPSNLEDTSEIVGQSIENPYGDGSGIIKLNRNSKDVTFYKISFGDGTVQDISNVIITYCYCFIPRLNFENQRICSLLWRKRYFMENHKDILF